MKLKMHLLFLIISCFSIGCATKTVSYHRYKIIKKYDKSYKFYLNDHLINLDTIFLNKSNVDKVRINRKSKCLNIYQKNKNPNFNSLHNLNITYQKTMESSDSLINIIDGILIDAAQQKSIKIEESVIKDITVLKKEEVLKSLPHARAGILIVTTK